MSSEESRPFITARSVLARSVYSRRPSLPPALESSASSVSLSSPTLPQGLPFYSGVGSAYSATAALSFPRKLSLDEAATMTDSQDLPQQASEPEPTDKEDTALNARLHQHRQQRQHCMPLATFPHASIELSRKDALSNDETARFSAIKHMLFSRNAAIAIQAEDSSMDWDVSDVPSMPGSVSMISSESSASMISSSAESGVSTVNTTLSNGQLTSQLPGSPSALSVQAAKSSAATQHSTMQMPPSVRSASSTGSGASSQTEDMDEDIPPPLSPSNGSVKSVSLRTPARESRESQQGSIFQANYSMGPVGSQPITPHLAQRSLPTCDGSSQLDASSDIGGQSFSTSPRGSATISQSLGLVLSDSPLGTFATGADKGNALPMQRPSAAAIKRAKRSSALSPLKIAPESAFGRPIQPTTPNGSFIPYARDGAATGEARSPFEPPTPFRTTSSMNGFPFGSASSVDASDRMPLPASTSLLARSAKPSRSGSLSPISADFAAVVSLSQSKLRDGSQSRSPSPATNNASRRASLMETPSGSSKRAAEMHRSSLSGPTRPKLIKSKSSMGKPYVPSSPYSLPNSLQSSSSGVFRTVNAAGQSVAGSLAQPSGMPLSGLVKPLITTTPPQPSFELPNDQLSGLPEPLTDALLSAKAAPSAMAKVPSVASRMQNIGKPVQPQAIPMDRSQSLPVYQTVSARHLAYRHLHPVFEANYTLGHELGSGGFGFVVAARRSQDGRPVAVKFIWKEKVPSHGWVRDPQLGIIPMEVFALKVIDHPNVVKFIELFDDDDFFYLVMEMHGSPWKAPEAIDDKKKTVALPPTSECLSPPQRHVPMERRSSCDLFECIEQHSRLSEEQARWVFAQVIEAVWHLDSLGICHRDIKDENCVVDSDFNVKLIDFGSAVVSDPRKPPPYFNRFFGTMTFASSEILQGKQYRAPHAEVWSLGVLLSILLSGQCPFSDPSAAIKGQISKPKGMWTKESLGLMLRCLEVDPDRRATIQELRQHPWVSKAWEVPGRSRPGSV
ncbi:kinase-like protein [Tilletiaria anomala UBC 951]|uniref:Kinase-like protein n=1 Tax=Tilletiaria anomala (strain ATCC 24038 / CBS 436.72 / UBC 951) TaxID=1037660 RepID=A0A066WHS2_TILAU|nr:kinase-like protein [Tilletiaria anomala UBC 951]KDN53562.1 kinase-like protein [Tilletiaria anomala UBC 951]